MSKFNLWVIFGASRGFGAAVAHAVAENAKDPVHMILVSRSMDDLDKLESELQMQVPDGSNIVTREEDLADVDNLDFEILLTGFPLAAYDCVYVIHNAGVLGNLLHVRDYAAANFGATEMRRAMDLNVTSPMVISAEFLRLMRKSIDTAAEGAVRLVFVNVSSLLAVQAFKAWGVYATGKAARNMFFKTLALEETKGVKTLNYAPGPMDTAMQEQVRKEMTDADQKKYFSDSFSEGKLVSPIDSARKMLAILTENKYESGAHIDYYDA